MTFLKFFLVILNTVQKSILRCFLMHVSDFETLRPLPLPCVHFPVVDWLSVVLDNRLKMLQAIFTFLVGVFWAFLFSLRAFLNLIRFGPSKYFYVNRNAAIPEELNDKKYGEHRIINLGTVKLHYVISGPENAPLMLLLHGFPEIWYSWRHQITEFQKDFRVVAVDMRGYGDSDKPKGLDNYKLDVLMDDVKLLIEALGYKSCVLLAHDWGGGVAWAFANKHSDMVDRLVALNMCPVPIWSKNAFSDIKQFICSGYIFFFFLPYLPEFLMSKNDLDIFRQMFNKDVTGLKSGPMSDIEIECYKHYYRQPGSLTPGINYYRANLYPPPVDHPLKYPMPIHIVWGVQDPFLSLKLLEETKKAVPHVTVTRIEDSSHWVQNDRPEKVNQAIRDFLKESQFGEK